MECRKLKAEINYLKNVQDSIRGLLEHTPDDVVPNINQQQLFADPAFRNLFMERNKLICLNDCIKTLIGSASSYSQQQANEIAHFSPVTCSSPKHTAQQKQMFNISYTALDENVDHEGGMVAGESSFSFEAGQRWSFALAEKACNSTGSTTFFEDEEKDKQGQLHHDAETEEHQRQHDVEREPPPCNDEKHVEQPQQPRTKLYTVSDKPDKSTTLNDKWREQANNSYDRLPKENKRSKNMTRAERKQMPGNDCGQCEGYWTAVGCDLEARALMQRCTRHRGPKRSATPPHYWFPGWVPTQEWEEMKAEEEKKKKRE